MAEAKKAGSVGYYQGRPVLVTDEGIFPLPAPLPIGPEEVTEAAEEYDAGKEAETATTPETEGVTSAT